MKWRILANGEYQQMENSRKLRISANVVFSANEESQHIDNSSKLRNFSYLEFQQIEKLGKRRIPAN